MKTSSRQSGFSAVLIIVIIAVVGLLGYLGYILYNNLQSDTANTSAEQSAIAEDVEAAPEVNSSEDLDTALTALEETDTESGDDNTELESRLSTF